MEKQGVGFRASEGLDITEQLVLGLGDFGAEILLGSVDMDNEIPLRDCVSLDMKANFFEKELFGELKTPLNHAPQLQHAQTEDNIIGVNEACSGIQSSTTTGFEPLVPPQVLPEPHSFDSVLLDMQPKR